MKIKKNKFTYERLLEMIEDAGEVYVGNICLTTILSLRKFLGATSWSRPGYIVMEFICSDISYVIRFTT